MLCILADGVIGERVLNVRLCFLVNRDDVLSVVGSAGTPNGSGEELDVSRAHVAHIVGHPGDLRRDRLSSTVMYGEKSRTMPAILFGLLSVSAEMTLSTRPLRNACWLRPR